MEYYKRSNLNKLPELIQLAPKAARSYLQFEEEVYQAAAHLSPKTKELIAVAVAHVTGCPYCIDVHTRKLRGLGGTKEELMEAVLVAASTRAGAVLSHATHAVLSYDDGEEEQPKPDCFC